jgi:hypothetical protein
MHLKKPRDKKHTKSTQGFSTCTESPSFREEATSSFFLKKAYRYASVCVTHACSPTQESNCDTCSPELSGTNSPPGPRRVRSARAQSAQGGSLAVEGRELLATRATLELTAPVSSWRCKVARPLHAERERRDLIIVLAALRSTEVSVQKRSACTNRV